jgi:hypothetical protein
MGGSHESDRCARAHFGPCRVQSKPSCEYHRGRPRRGCDRRRDRVLATIPIGCAPGAAVGAAIGGGVGAAGRLDDASSAAPAGLRATASAGAGLRAASSELRAASGLRVAGWLRPRIGESRPQSPRPRDGGSHCSEVTVPSFAGWRSIDANFADAPRRRPPESNDPLRLMSCCAVQASRWAVHWPRREPSTPPARSAPPEPGQRKAGRQVAGSRHH